MCRSPRDRQAKPAYVGSGKPRADDGRDTIRFFSWWKEGRVDGEPTGRVDIDRPPSCMITTGSMSSISLIRICGHPRLSTAETSCRPSACEFIDLHIPSIVQYGALYCGDSSFVYESTVLQPPECFMGWMMRKKPGSGEIFEPSTVAIKSMSRRYADRYSCYFGFGTYGYLDRSVPDETSTLLQQCRRESEGWS